MKAKNSIYVKKNMLFYLELSSRDLSDRKSREKATKPLLYVSQARKLEGNVWNTQRALPEFAPLSKWRIVPRKGLFTIAPTNPTDQCHVFFSNMHYTGAVQLLFYCCILIVQQ